MFEETARGTIIRIALAAILYVVGAAGVIYVAIREDVLPGSVVKNYWPLLVCGMILVVVAALLLPVARSSEAPNGGDRDEEEDAESGV